MKTVLKNLSFSVLTIGLALGGSYYFVKKELAQANLQKIETAQPQLVSQVNRPLSNLDNLSFVQAADASMPTVVHITAIQHQTQTNNRSQFDGFFQFGLPFNEPQGPAMGTGSGVILSKDGYIVTNNHVVQGADEITVTTYDKKKLTAAIVGRDPSTDIAVLKVESTDLPFIEIADSDEVKVGEWVLAVGNPFDLSSTVTAGIVSAKARNIRIIKDRFSIESFIQTDAAVNPGNSGGALVNLEGELIGINTAIASKTGSYSGYSFAVPANIAMKVVDDIITYGVTQRGFLGVQIVNVSDLNEVEKEKLNIASNEGVYVDGLVEGGAAEIAGVKKGDVITAVNGKSIKTAPELQEAVGVGRPGDAFSIQVDRSGLKKTMTLKLKKATVNE